MSSLTETHHALLFAWIARAVIEQVGAERGEEVILQAVRQYGEERGSRMAQRARANRHRLSMANYLAYSEWQSSQPDLMEQHMDKRTPDALVRATRCPWHTTWQAHDLVAFGRLYCQEIDTAICRGYNPALQLDVLGTRTDGVADCAFVYRGANLTPVNLLLLTFRRRIHPGKSARQPWSYHVGHLFTTFERVITANLGDSGQTAIAAGLAAFTAHFGAASAQQLTSYLSVDFTRVPA